MRRPLAVLVAALATASACAASESSEVGCTDVLPACPASGAPSYASTVAPIVAAACLSCHAPGGPQASRPFETYAHLYAQRGSVLNQVHACAMPPSNGPVLPAADRQTLETWLVCGAPAN